MDKLFITKDIWALIIYCISYLPVLIYFLIYLFRNYKRIKNKEKIDLKERQKIKRNTIILISYLVIYSFIPIDKIIDLFPNNHNTIEEAFKFDYDSIGNVDPYKLVYKNKNKNTYFVVGRRTESIPYRKKVYMEEFNCYSKTNNDEWKLLTNSGKNKVGMNDDSGYVVYYFSNQKDNITGIFISAYADAAKIDENFKIKDKYGTKFEYITGKDGKPLKFFNRVNYIYFGVVNHSIENGYDIKIEDETVRIK